MSLYARRRLRTLGLIMATSGLGAATFNFFTDERSWSSLVQGLVDGVLVGGVTSGWVLFVREGVARRRFRDLGFLTDLCLNALALLSLFLLMRGLGQVVTSGEPARFIESFRDPHLRLAAPFFLVGAFVAQLIVQMNRMIGTNVLAYFVGGVYRRPKQEQRIFLFVDLVGSTQLAERLGRERYYELLGRFVKGLTEPILESNGEIYQYAGDEVLITWRFDQGVRDANCIRCFVLAQRALEESRASYERDFGCMPEFRGGLHGGAVIAGELGELKQEIVFVGDVLNTAARLEEYAKTSGRSLVVSGSLLEQLTLPEGVASEFLEELAPRGKEERIAVYAVDRV